MKNELLAATIFAAAVGAQIEMQGMVAENAQHQDAQPYGENAFMMLKDSMENRIAEAYKR